MNILRKKSYQSFGFAFLLWGVACGYINISNAETSSNCQALVETSNDLWFASPNGTLLKRLTTDGQNKDAAALSPDGKFIVYSGKLFSNDVALIDNNGNLLASVDVKANQAIIGVDWITSNLFYAEEHISPTNSYHHFVQIPSGNFSAESLQQLPVTAGANCRISPTHNDVVCIEGDVINLNDKAIYFPIGSPDSIVEVQNISASIGDEVNTSTNPSFKVKILEMVDKQVSLKITTPDNLWKIQAIDSGKRMPVDFFSAGIKTTYLVSPIFSNTQNNREIKLSILKDDDTDSNYEGGLAWDPRGKRIAAVEADGTGKRYLILMNKELGTAAQNNKGAVDAKQLLPIDGPISSITFTSATHIRVEGATQVFDQDIPAQGKVSDKVAFTVTDALPKQIQIMSGTTEEVAQVYGWTCSQ